jgi:hypothetical protein
MAATLELLFYVLVLGVVGCLVYLIAERRQGGSRNAGCGGSRRRPPRRPRSGTEPTAFRSWRRCSANWPRPRRGDSPRSRVYDPSGDRADLGQPGLGGDRLGSRGTDRRRSRSFPSSLAPSRACGSGPRRGGGELRTGGPRTVGGDSPRDPPTDRRDLWSWRRRGRPGRDLLKGGGTFCQLAV